MGGRAGCSTKAAQLCRTVLGRGSAGVHSADARQVEVHLVGWLVGWLVACLLGRVVGPLADLDGRQARWQAQALVVAVRHDHAADEPRGHAPAALMDQLVPLGRQGGGTRPSGAHGRRRVKHMVWRCARRA